MNDMLVCCSGLTKSYGAKPALDHVDLQLAPGKIIGLLGMDCNTFCSIALIRQDAYGLFLEADSSVLIKRYKETRRNHPLALQGRVDKAIEAEREELAFIKKRADYILDTSHMLVRDLKQEIDKIFLGKDEYENFFVTILSFGFKYGIPEDSDLVFDVRFLPNPYYIPDLKPQTGNDRAVYDYVMSSPQAVTFEKQLFEMVEFLIPNYILEGKNQLVISIGCTGGKHRSVTLVNALAKHMKQLPYSIKVEHRDIEKDRKQGK